MNLFFDLMTECAMLELISISTQSVQTCDLNLRLSHEFFRKGTRSSRYNDLYYMSRSRRNSARLKNNSKFHQKAFFFIEKMYVMH